MEYPNLEVPPQNDNPAVSGFVNPARLNKWLAALPSGNATKTGQDLLAALYQVNRARLPAGARFAMLEHCRPLIHELLVSLRKHYASASLPLPEKHRPMVELVHSLLHELANGYKSVVLAPARNAANEPIGGGDSSSPLAPAIFRAMTYLARLLVDTYSLYAPEPKYVWLELHQLYRYAEQRQLLTQVAVTDSPGNAATIDHAYRRIVLLALANPYHLMQGEATVVYAELEKWAPACRITPLSMNTRPKGQLYIDLEQDEPPRFASAKLNLPTPQEGRIVDVSAVLKLLQARVKDVLSTGKTGMGQLSLVGRTARNMYRRLAEAWGVRTERLSNREQRATPLEIVAGISACHHYCSAGERFAPEEAELRLRSHHSGGGLNANLTLVSEAEMPWLNEDQSQRLSTGIIQPRTSRFSSPAERNSKDMWVQVYSTSAAHAAQQEQATSFDTIVCQLRDESRGGMAIVCGKIDGIQVRVGEVVGYKSGHSPDSGGWSLGAVRWIRLNPNQHLELGIRTLADDTLPVATKGIKGVGMGGEYLRSLLIPRLDPTHYPTTLITPAAAYDVDSVLLLNLGDKLLYAHLTKLLDSTNSYARFQFALVETPSIQPKEANSAKNERHLD